ncbi:hypothetical protein NEOLEDRAFT_1102507 [Neolentinus lepideus HHB14362 ss-1]|uniref:C2H2-type domain-containing protein n=1 Tax=Neolentinus lepideus HHB14362 ss-1 TaxID=1314782 RepID=A0A165N866_9AGAM|nr:hypothetical protein NEOLEDRAFT_1102507 [Neolentinus lepideus HHB14362 ss-1]
MNPPMQQWILPPPPDPDLNKVVQYRAPLGDFSPNINRQIQFCHPESPMLNAHLGVDVEALRDKVERYKLRHPGQEIDNTWFFPFVGKLSDRGELLEDYRCYIKGCNQRNKRRDHIVTHVGSHVDHRPYECGHCGQRFLRKNECKRHESRHAVDFKAFTCNLCSADESKSYSRQDTLKRHMTKAHGVPPMSGIKEKCRRRKAKAKDPIADGRRWMKLEYM